MNRRVPRPAASEWIATYPAEIIVCDQDGTILDMSDVAIRIYEKEGGAALIGSSVFDHHPEPARSQMVDVVNRRSHVVYTTEKAGRKKLISIGSWFRNGEYAGFTLITLDLPATVPNIVKD